MIIAWAYGEYRQIPTQRPQSVWDASFGSEAVVTTVTTVTARYSIDGTDNRRMALDGASSRRLTAEGTDNSRLPLESA